MRRTAILVDERDRTLGQCAVPESTFAIWHGDGLFVRTANGIRLHGGGIGVIYEQTEPVERNKLEPM